MKLIFLSIEFVLFNFQLQSNKMLNQGRFQAEKIQIDGDGGILEAAMSPDHVSAHDKSSSSDYDNNNCERLCDRI